MSDAEGDPRLHAAAEAAQRVAAARSGELGESDRAELVAAFHRAESLAASALEAATLQVETRYRAELREQLQDEVRHIDVFARWMSAPAEHVPPRPRQRPTPVWLLLLLANELAGYCQFHMLLALLGDSGKRAQVREILADEERHIARLDRWLEPWWRDPVASVMRDIGDGFTRGLVGRMHQFFPRAELGALREEMAAVCADLLAAYTRDRY